MTQELKSPIKLFYSYAHEDETLRKKLEKHLALLHRQGYISSWHDRSISPGSNWEQEISIHLNTAQIILLLVSSNFLASDFCYSVEMKRALERHESGEALVIPIILRPCDWKSAIFSKLQALPTDAKPITKWQDRDDAFLDVAEGIRKAVKELNLAHKATLKPLKQIWNVPFNRNPYFTGREDLLNHLHSLLGTDKTATPVQAISGLGGIGKTQIAMEYAYRHRDAYCAILWIRATRNTFLSDFAMLAEPLDLPEKDEQNQNMAVTAVKQWLRTHDGWLLILDDVEDLSMVREFLPTGGTGHMLLTTRAYATGAVATPVEIEKMNLEESTQLLLRRARIITTDVTLDQVAEPERSKAKTIVEIMDGLPLALDQTGAYIEETGCGLSRYLDLYQEHSTELLKRRSALSPEYPHTVATTWSLSFQQIERDDPAASDLLRLCAFLAPEAIPEEILTEGAKALSPVLKSVASKPLELNKAMETLYKFSLVRRNADTGTLVIHRLVQMVIKDRMNKKTRHQWARRAVRAVGYAFPAARFSNWKRCQRLLPHVYQCSALIEQDEIAFAEAALLLNQSGWYLLERGLYDRAEPFLQQALAIFEKVSGPEHPYAGATLNHLARLYWSKGEYDRAEPLLQRALAIFEKAVGPETPEASMTLNNLARLYYLKGDYFQALPLFQRCLAIDEKTLGLEHRETTTVLDNLAQVYKALDRYSKEAEALFLQALSLKEKVLGLGDPSTATTLENLAYLYYLQGRNTQAEPLFLRALSIKDRELGPDHPESAAILNKLALLYETQGRDAEAETLFLRALAINEEWLGPEHPDTSIYLGNLAHFYSSHGQEAQAEGLFLRTLNIQEKHLGSEHLLAITLDRLAHLYLSQGRDAEAEPLFLRSLALNEQVFGPDSASIANALNSLAAIYLYQGKYSKAESLFLRVLSIVEKVSDMEELSKVNVLNNLTYLYFFQGRYIQAESFLRRTLTLKEKIFGSEHPDIVPALKQYADLLMRMGRVTEALKLERRADEIQSRDPQQEEKN